MRYFKEVNGGYIESISTGFGETEITESEYTKILSIIKTAPIAKDGYAYLLRSDTLKWELLEVKPVEEDLEEQSKFDSMITCPKCGYKFEKE